jgi:uncharacterized protein
MLAETAFDAVDDRRALERRCVATRSVRPVGELMRFVVAPDGSLAPDLKRKLPGRGVWVTATRSAFDDAVRTRAFSRSLKAPVAVSADLADRIDELLLRSALDMLSLANKAGLVVAGFAKVEDRLKGGRAAAVLTAREAAADGVRKLASASRNAHFSELAPPFITIFESRHFDLALGRSNVIHAALGVGPATTGFLTRVAALARWRGGDPASAGSRLTGEAPPQADADPTERDGRPMTGGNNELDEIRGDPQDLARND